MRFDTASGLEIRLDTHRTRLRVTVVGDIDGSNVATFASVVEDACSSPMDVDIDLAAVDFIGVCGMEHLHRAYRRRRVEGRHFRVGPISPNVARLFARLGHPCADHAEQAGLAATAGRDEPSGRD